MSMFRSAEDARDVAAIFEKHLPRIAQRARRKVQARAVTPFGMFLDIVRREEK